MSTRNLLLLLIPLAAIVGLLFLYEPPVREDSVSSSGIVYDADVERTVQAFGQKLKDVSLQSSNASAEIDAAYGPYVSSGLLDQWKSDPASAPGRLTSSPWPGRIQVGSMQGEGDSFVVHGTVIDVANGDSGEEIVGTYPVEVWLRKMDGEWRIVHFEAGAYSKLPARASVVGTYTCLPHRDTSGPQTMECAFGIRDEVTGEHYAVDLRLMASTVGLDTPTGSRVSIEGIVTPIEALSSDQWRKYDIVGIISATSMKRL